MLWVHESLRTHIASAAVGLSALTAVIRALRGDAFLGNYFVDMWRVLAYLFVPVAFMIALIFIQQGSPMIFESSYQIATLEPAAMGVNDDGQAKPQTIVVGPVAAFEAIKMLGTNGGGFYGMNSAHPFENPTALSNFFNTLAMMFFPFALVLMYGRMLGRFRHGLVIFSVMLLLMTGTVVWSVYFDTLQPNLGLGGHPMARTYEIPGATTSGTRQITLPAVAGLPVDQHLGNLEGKELRFGTSAGSTFAALTTLWCGQRGGGQSQPFGGPFAHGRDVAQLHFRRQGRRHDQYVAVYHNQHRDSHRDQPVYSHRCPYCDGGLLRL